MYYFCVEKALLLSVQENIASNTAERLDPNPNLRERHVMPSDHNTRSDEAKAPSSLGEVTKRNVSKHNEDAAGTYFLWNSISQGW